MIEYDLRLTCLLHPIERLGLAQIFRPAQGNNPVEHTSTNANSAACFLQKAHLTL